MEHDEPRILPYRLTTAEITFHMPDHPGLLQNFIWQDLDIDPDYPVLNRFLRYWENNLDGRLHTVKVAARLLIKPPELRFAASSYQLH